MLARDIMSREVVTVTAETTVKVAAELLASKGYTALPVLDEDGGLIGILTEDDVVRDRFPRDPRYRCSDAGSVLGQDAEPDPGMSVGAVMTTPVIGVGAGTDVVDLVTAMREEGLRTMPIVDGSAVVGIVTRRDLLRTLARDDRLITADVRHQLEIYGGVRRWRVSVLDGEVTIHDEFDDETDRHVAEVLAEAVPGVVTVHVDSREVLR